MLLVADAAESQVFHAAVRGAFHAVGDAAGLVQEKNPNGQDRRPERKSGRRKIAGGSLHSDKFTFLPVAAAE